MKHNHQPKVARVSEDTIMVRWSEPTTTSQWLILIEKIRAVGAEIQNQLTPRELVPSFNSLLIQLASVASTTDADQLIEDITQCVENAKLAPTKRPRSEGQLHKVPVCYDEHYALDRDLVCAETGMSWDEVKQAHQSQEYCVMAMGFMPGFGYLGFSDDHLSVSRHEQFRQSVAAGSVALAATQSAVYPVAGPGGWKIIGRTPMSMFNGSLALLSVGDKVRFTAITQQEFDEYGV